MSRAEVRVWALAFALVLGVSIVAGILTPSDLTPPPGTPPYSVAPAVPELETP
jgi:hypothetical protein